MSHRVRPKRLKLRDLEGIIYGVKIPPSPIPHLLPTNEPINDAEVVAVKNALAEARERRETLALCGSRCDPVENFLTWSRAQYMIRDLDCFIQQHEVRISTSLILKLPIELLQEIFMDVTDILVEETSKMPINEKMRTRDVPWQICAVCQSWRVVAMDTPYLWRSLPPVRLSEPISRFPGFMGAFQELVQRSRGLSIHVRIVTGPEPDLQHPALKLLLKQTDRWFSLDIMMECKSVLRGRFIRDMLSNAKFLPSLRTVDISWKYGSGELSDQSAFTILELKAPLLQEVTWDENTIGLLLPSSSMIQKLSFSNSGWVHGLDQCLQLIDNSTSTLTDLSLDTWADMRVLFGTLLLPKLVRLHFYSRGLHTGRWFLDRLIVPSLRHLSLQSMTANNLCSTAASMICRSNCSDICELRIVQDKSPTGLSNLLAVTPLLRRLEITIPHLKDIQDLSVQDSGNFTLAPILSSCVFNAENCLFHVEKPICDEKIKAINTFASKRFTSCGKTSSSSFLNTNGFPSYPKTLSIDFQLDVASRLGSTQCALNSWPTSVESKSLESKNERLKSILFDVIRSSKKSFDDKKGKEFLTILRHTFDTKIDHVGDILNSRIHLTLVNISRYCTSFAEYLQYAKIADKILEKWEPIFEQNISRLHWQIIRDSTLQYVQNGEMAMKNGIANHKKLKKWAGSALIAFL